MKNLIYIILLVAAPLYAQSEFEMGIKLTNSNGDTINRALFGIKANATNQIDADYGEFAIPSLFPTILSSAFTFYDATYEENVMSYKDFRPYFNGEKDSIVYTFEVAGIINSFKLEWGDFPEWIKTAYIKSKFISDNYNYFNMLTTKEIEVLNSAVTEFYIVIKNYSDETNVEENRITDTKLIISPLPIANELNIVSEIQFNKAIIVNSIGEQYHAKVIDNRIDMSNFSAGTYNLMLFDSKNQVIRKNIIKY